MADITKSDLIEKIVVDYPQVTKRQAADVVGNILGTITSALASGRKVKIHDFGSFTVKDYAERTGINPKTGESLTIPARKVVKFSAYTALKEAVNG